VSGVTVVTNLELIMYKYAEYKAESNHHLHKTETGMSVCVEGGLVKAERRNRTLSGELVCQHRGPACLSK